jgi:hypothetical protein
MHVYVFDTFVLPSLGIYQLPQGPTRSILLDGKTRDYIKENFGFRWVAVANGTQARDFEDRFKRGEIHCGFPLLNPDLKAVEGHRA